MSATQETRACFCGGLAALKQVLPHQDGRPTKLYECGRCLSRITVIESVSAAAAAAR